MFATHCRRIIQPVDRGRDNPPDAARDAIQIELRLDGSMPAGIATGPAGRTRDFIGWVGLMAAVDAVAEREQDQMSEDGKGENGH